jgi:NitT/TauT family transport system ATP-binding protein
MAPPAVDAPPLRVAGVTLQYRADDRLVTAAYRVSFDVLRSDRFVVLGPSGCGKSTLLKAIGGYVPPVEGEIVLNGARVAGPGPDRAFVFQEFDQLLPWKTVRDNIVFALTASGTLARRDALDKARHYIAKVGLEDFAQSFPHTLSGGMKQRVAIARSLAMEPQVLLMDEPFGSLDAQTRMVMQELLLQVWEQHHQTVLFITHDIEEALLLADRVCVMTARPGRIKKNIDVRIPRPRAIEVTTSPEFNALRREVLALIREESEQAAMYSASR